MLSLLIFDDTLAEIRLKHFSSESFEKYKGWNDDISIPIFTMSYSGTVDIRVIEGRDLKNRYGLENTHPAVKISCGRQTKQTKRSKGQAPIWNETMKFDIYPGQTILAIMVEDDRIPSESEIGSATINLDNLRAQTALEQWVEVRHGKEYAGLVKLAIAFNLKENMNATQPTGMQFQYQQPNPSTGYYPPQPTFYPPPYMIPSVIAPYQMPYNPPLQYPPTTPQFFTPNFQYQGALF